jgi:hypothetical protein
MGAAAIQCSVDDLKQNVESDNDWGKTQKQSIRRSEINVSPMR